MVVNVKILDIGNLFCFSIAEEITMIWVSHTIRFYYAQPQLYEMLTPSANIKGRSNNLKGGDSYVVLNNPNSHT